MKHWLSFLLFFYFIYSVNNTYAARPTVQVSNLTFANLRCNGVQLNWTNGNGSARIIVAREGTTPDYTPLDNQAYSASSKFAGSTNYGSNNFIVYNSTGTNFAIIDSLKPCTTYYFDIYEHDNNGSNTLYLSPPASISITTYCLTMSFSTIYIDSCEKKNGYLFSNNSSSTIPGISYQWDFGDGNTSTTNPNVLHTYTSRVGRIPVLLIATPSLGCNNIFSSNVRVYPKRNAFIDYNTFKDTQCFEGNYFEVDPQPVASPPGLSYSFSYKWFFGDGTIDTSFRRMKKRYASDGTFNVELEITLNFTFPAGSEPKKSGCKDTLRFDVVVLPSPVGSASINDTFQCLTGNNFNFTNSDNSLTYFKWYFGNGDSSSLKTVSYNYTDTGIYRVIHEAFAGTGCKGRDTVFVRVVPDLNSNFTGLDTFYCASLTPVNLVPTLNNGIFSGYPLAAPNTIETNTAGNFSLKYIVKNNFCADTTEKNFRVQALPTPNLGKDTAQCSGGDILLNANEIGTYLWNTGETTATILASSTNTYAVNVTQGKCSAADTIDVLFSTIPRIQLGKDTIICKGAGLRLNANSFGATYLWNTGSTDSIIFAYNQGKYSVRAENECGFAEDSIFISVQSEYCDLFMANAFSPDNDLLNAVFMPRGRNITVLEFKIFNRWGELVFDASKETPGWNGKYKDQPCEQGLYIWKLFYTTPAGDKIKKSNAFGQVLLLR